jgi:hypothetical protein
MVYSLVSLHVAILWNYLYAVVFLLILARMYSRINNIFYIYYYTYNCLQFFLIGYLIHNIIKILFSKYFVLVILCAQKYLHTILTFALYCINIRICVCINNIFIPVAILILTNSSDSHHVSLSHSTHFAQHTVLTTPSQSQPPAHATGHHSALQCGLLCPHF